MPVKVVLSLLLGAFNLLFWELPQASKPVAVKIEQTSEGSFRLLRNGEPYFIKGAVGHHYLEKLKAYGGNSIRSNPKQEQLDKAHKLGLSVLVNLPVRAQRDGMNYDDTKAVQKQHQEVLKIVRRTKDHPAVLMWSLGNELDFIQANEVDHYNLKGWDAVNALARDIRNIDPHHPAITVVGSISQDKIKQLNARCPDIDALGVNEYGD